VPLDIDQQARPGQFQHLEGGSHREAAVGDPPDQGGHGREAFARVLRQPAEPLVAGGGAVDAARLECCSGSHLGNPA